MRDDESREELLRGRSIPGSRAPEGHRSIEIDPVTVKLVLEALGALEAELNDEEGAVTDETEG